MTNIGTYINREDFMGDVEEFCIHMSWLMTTDSTFIWVD